MAHENPAARPVHTQAQSLRGIPLAGWSILLDDQLFIREFASCDMCGWVPAWACVNSPRRPPTLLTALFTYPLTAARYPLPNLSVTSLYEGRR